MHTFYNSNVVEKKLVWEHVLSRKKSLTQNACGVPTKLQSIAGSGLKSGL